MSRIKYEVYKIDTYDKANKDFIKNNKEEYTLKELEKALKEDKGFHYRIHKNQEYIFFGDIDGYEKGIDNFKEKLINFMKNSYDLELEEDEIKYTENNKKSNSYHYSIPKWNLKVENLKDLHNNFIKEYNNDNNIKKAIDTTIYSEHWFRCPNQRKGIKDDNSQHIIKRGTMKDFIIEYIPKKSININNKKYKEKEVIENEECDEIIERIEPSEIIEINKENKIAIKGNQVLTRTLTEPLLYKEIFGCYKQVRFENYEYWINIGMALKNIFDNKIGLELFDYFSKQGINYKGYEKTKKQFETFIKKSDGLTVATIYYYALEDDKPKFIEIMNKNTFDLEQADMAKYTHILANTRFIYKKEDNVYKLYCYNGKIWVKDDILLKHFLSNELYDFLKMILVELYFEHHTFDKMKNQIKKLKSQAFKRDIVDAYKEVGLNEDIQYDNKWWLLGFNNVVYDLEQEEMREYKYDDYVSTTTGYDWREPTDDELSLMNKLINEIMPHEDERELYLQILSTSLDGRCLEKMVILNGSGSNGKGMINDILLKAVGNYGLIGNNSILFESSRTGANPEKSSMHKKRLVLFREPSEKNKFENSVIKELTGGGTFSARSCYESSTQKELNLTMLIECNTRCLFAEEPKNSEIRRIIDMLFRTTYTENNDLIDEKNNIYKANIYYKQPEFQEKHKYALLKILMDAHKRYKKNNSILKIPKSVEERTNLYLEMSCNIVTWFKDTYENTNERQDNLKLKDIYDEFMCSIYFANISKMEKKKYNKSYFKEYVSNNIFFKKYYREKSDTHRNIIKGWKKREEEKDEEE